jgi:hypothetical protein
MLHMSLPQAKPKSQVPQAFSGQIWGDFSGGAIGSRPHAPPAP